MSLNRGLCPVTSIIVLLQATTQQRCVRSVADRQIHSVRAMTRMPVTMVHSIAWHPVSVTSHLSEIQQLGSLSLMATQHS